MDAVSTVIPGGATGAAPPVDSDAPAPAAGFPAALGQALAQPAVAADGNSPPAIDGQTLPVLPVVTDPAAEPITPPIAAVAADGLPLPAEPQPSGAVAAVVDALGDIARGQKAAPAAAHLGAPPPSPAASSDPVTMPGVARGAVQETGAGEEHGRDTEPQLAATPTAVQVPESAPGAARKAARRLASEGAADPAAAGQLPPGLLLHAAPIARTVASAHAAPDGGHGRQAAVVGAAAEQPAASAMTATGAVGLEVAMAAQPPGPANESAPVGTLPGNELAAALQLAGRPGVPAASGGPPVELPVAASPGSPQFSQELGERLLWLVREGVHEARLQLNPRELGPIEVRVGVSDGTAQLSFSAQHAGTVAAVQQSLPQLRELLAQQGLQLGQADVSQQQAGAGQQTPQQGSSQQAAAESRGSAAGMGGPVIGERVRVIGRGLVDAYA
ncbi:flagellar hook-length control protein FliK [Immundisolibacter cernigliae]|uniref:flagellar hook-length control protein FliK n=1 Tax=Immundisolibacter cernigliae TaxID=1810504 RepID=UPI000ADA1F91|nr:flagellar hook-length control protein FliK [Immundisolibacter cernigliae]